jgi:hypothetical protein
MLQIARDKHLPIQTEKQVREAQGVSEEYAQIDEEIYNMRN